jgi:NADH-quinone oxidoreductase subunit F
VDLKLLDAEPSDDERDAVDGLLGAPTSAWDGGARGSHVDYHSALGGRAVREQRHLLVPALQRLQARVGWISEGGLNYVCTRLGVPPAEAWGVATFYALLATSPRPKRVLHVCDDIACRNLGARELCSALARDVGPALGHAAHGDTMMLDAERGAWMHSPCLGMCDNAPAALLTQAGATHREVLLGNMTLERAEQVLAGGEPGVDASHVASNGAAHSADEGATDDLHVSRTEPVLLARIGRVDPTSLDDYRANGGYEALAKAFELGPEGVIRELVESRLVGRGGAAFPTGRKWDAVRVTPSGPRYIVCNADESEPGTFKDRVLLANDPFAIIEAMTIAGFATGSERGFIYVRAEYPLASERLSNAIVQARRAGLLGDDIMQRGLRFDIEIRRGAGAYICGEETALFESIEGKRGEPRSKPPFPVNYGLFGRPTVVNNVETLANVLPILRHGGAAFAATGTAGSTGTRLFCLSGAVRNAGVYEVPYGMTLRQLLQRAGGLRPGRTLTAVLLGGAAGTFVRPDELDLPLTLEDARAAGTTLGSGVVMAFDETMDLRDVVLRIAAFFRDESCGQCVPCRVGTVRQEEALHRIVRGRAIGGVGRELSLLDEVGVAMRDASICGLGQTAYAAVESAIRRLRLFDEASNTTDSSDSTDSTDSTDARPTVTA